MADDLTPNAKALARQSASAAVATALIGGMIGILEAGNSTFTDQVDELFSSVILRIDVVINSRGQSVTEIEKYYQECFKKEVEAIQSLRKSSRTRAEKRLREKSVPKA